MLPEGMWDAQREQSSGALASLFNRFRGRAESPVLISGGWGARQFCPVLLSFAWRSCRWVHYTRTGDNCSRSDCAQYIKLGAERQIPVQWDPNSESRHSGTVQVVCRDKPGLLANITKVCEQAQVNINRFEAHGLHDDRAVCTLGWLCAM